MTLIVLRNKMRVRSTRAYMYCTLAEHYSFINCLLVMDALYYSLCCLAPVAEIGQ